MNPLRTILLVLLPLAALGELQESRERNIVVEAPGDAARPWLDFALRADQDVRKLLGTGDAVPAGMLHLRIATGDQSNHPLRLALTGKEFHIHIAQRIYAALILRAAAPDRARPPELRSATWLAAALASRELSVNPQRPARSVAYYEPVRASFRGGAFPDVLRLTTHPVPPEHPALFRFYTMHCDLLMAAVQAAKFPDGNPFAQILQFEAQGNDPASALAAVLQPALAEGETVQAWYERVAPPISRRGSRQKRAEVIVEELEDLTSVPAMTRQLGDIRVSRVRLEDLPESLPDHPLDRAGIADIYAKVYELSKDAPWLLHEPLYAYMSALDQLGKGNKRAFKKAMQRARADFEQATRRQIAIEALLDQLQESYDPPDDRLDIYFDTVGRTDRDLRALDPKLHDVLDQASR
ncbi:MAG: hypothetical protein RBU25_15910 [Lentisphaeria bacterium]|jgi:hypothetical protein|nr:hypothetical protein [Lentisphaeria bacterium]